MMADQTLTAYDEVLYPSYTHNQTHPDRLATIATLFGLTPAPVERCRVLELGCGNGSNLVPMAYGLPGSEFVGIDLAARPVAKGQEMAAALGLRNVTLRQGSIIEVSSAFGLFDYIIAHGVYSWVPPNVSEQVLEICRANLAPSGVAFVSYNVYPGNHLRHMLREMMLFHVRGFESPAERVKQAIALIRFLAESKLEADPYRLFLKDELEKLLTHEEGHLYHDELAEFNAPLYFHEFVTQAAQHELQYLGEADYFEMLDDLFPSPVSQTLRQLGGNRILREQYLDFLKCRRFRQTLLCHKNIPLNTTPRPAEVVRFHLSSSAHPVSPKPELDSKAIERFESIRGAKMETDFPLAKAAMVILGEIWPQQLHFSELLTRARARLGDQPELTDRSLEEQTQQFCALLLQTYGAGLVELHLHAPNYAQTASERPVASPVARWQIRQGDFVTTLRHLSVQVEDELGRQLLTLLDGTRDRTALLRELTAFLQSRGALAAPNHQAAAGAESTRQKLAEDLEKNLAKLARLALLIA